MPFQCEFHLIVVTVTSIISEDSTTTGESSSKYDGINSGHQLNFLGCICRDGPLLMAIHGDAGKCNERAPNRASALVIPPCKKFSTPFYRLILPPSKSVNNMLKPLYIYNLEFLTGRKKSHYWFNMSGRGRQY